MSIQQRIASDVYRMAEKAVTPEQIKSIQAHLVKSVQTGAVPSYVGIPLLNDLNQKMARIQTAPAQAQAMVQQPPLAQQVMGQAEQGVETLPSGLPEQGMAGGGIVAFAGGGEAMSPTQMASYLLADEDDEDDDYVNAILHNISSLEDAESDDSGIGALMAAQERESVSTKEGNQPARGVTRERTSVSGPAGLADLLKMIEQKESGGRGDYDKYGNLLTSSAGAQGRMQVMPATSRDPGFGIRPAREGDVEDLARVGREYYTKMLDRYQDPKLAAIAYNWGPGNTDKWLSSGASIDKLPRETRNYVANMREGGIAHFQNTGIVTLDPNDPDSWRSRSSSPEVRAAEPKGGYKDITKMTPEEIKEAARRRIRMESARAAVPSAASAPAAAPSAAAPAAASDLTYGQRLLRFLSPSGGGAVPLTGIGTLGGYMSYGAANQMRNLSQEQREQLTGDIGSDTSFAAAITNESTPGGWTILGGQPTPTAPAKPAGVATLPTAPRMPVTASNTTGQSYRRTEGAPSPDDRRQAFESAVGATQDAEDAETELKLPPPEASTETEKGAGKEEGGIRSILDKFRTDIGKQRDIDNYLSLLSSGLGMMGGTSPFAAANIGQGAQQGIRTYQQAAQLRGADERGLLSAELGLKKYQSLEDIKRLALSGQQAANAGKLEQRAYDRASEAIRRYEQQAQNNARMRAQERIKAASKDLINPMSDQQRSDIFEEEFAREMSALRNNQVYRRHMQNVVPGYKFDDNKAGSEQPVLTYDRQTKSLR